MNMNEQFLKVSTASLKEITDVYEQQIYIYLKKNTNIAGFCSSSYSFIADAMNISRAKVISVVETLIQKGLIKKERVINSNGSYGVNHYYLCDTPDFWQTNKRKEMLDEFIENHADYSTDSNISQAAAFPFVKVFYDFIESKKLNVREKSLYIALKRYRNSQSGLCFPALKTLAAATDCCIKTVTKYINMLVEKGIIQKDTYYNSSSGKMASCRYTLHDDAELFREEKNEKITSVKVHRSRKKLKKEASVLPAKVPAHEWTNEMVREYYNYEEIVALAQDEKIESKYVDTALDIIRHELNVKSKTFSYKGEQLPHKVLQAEYEKLTPPDIISAVSIYLQQYNKINNHEAYLKILLYKIRQQSILEVANTVNNILYNA